MTTPTPIQLDLRDLTDAMIAEALPHSGACSYQAPCIIGTLMTLADRTRFDDGSPTIEHLLETDRVEMPANQHELAVNLQNAFDCDNLTGFDNLIAKIRALPAKETIA